MESENVDMKVVKIVKASIVKEMVHGLGAHVGLGVIDALDHEVKVLLARAYERAKENSRTTVMKKDL